MHAKFRIPYVHIQTIGGKTFYTFRPPKHMAECGVMSRGFGQDRERAIRESQEIMANFRAKPKPATAAERAEKMLPYLKLCVTSAKHRAKGRGFPCTITVENLLEMFIKQGGRCALSGIQFEMSKHKDRPSFRRPYAPSIDRINCAKGYETGNVRLVCSVVNFALADWGHETLLEVARGLIEWQARIPRTPVPPVH